MKIQKKNLPEFSIRIRNHLSENVAKIKCISDTSPQVNIAKPTQMKKKNMVETCNRKREQCKK